MSTEYRRVTDGQTDGRTDRQISCHGIARAMYRRRAVKTKLDQSPTQSYRTER